MKRERHVRLRTKFVKSGVNEKIGHVNGAIQSDELESINVTNTCTDKYIKNFECLRYKGQIK